MPTFLRLLTCVRPYWRRLVAALVCMAAFALLSSVSLGMIVPFVNVLFERDTLVGADGPGALGPRVVRPPERIAVKEALEGAGSWVLFAAGTPEGALGKMCIALLAVFLIKSIFGYLQTFLMITVEQRIIRDLRDRLFGHICRLSLSFFHGKRTGLLISRVTNDVTLVKGALVASFANLFREGLLALLYLGIAVWVSWKLSLITFVVLPPILFLIVRVGQRLRKRSARIQEKMADITATLQESITGARVVRAFGMEEYEERRFFKHTRRVLPHVRAHGDPGRPCGTSDRVPGRDRRGRGRVVRRAAGAPRRERVARLVPHLPRRDSLDDAASEEALAGEQRAPDRARRRVQGVLAARHDAVRRVAARRAGGGRIPRPHRVPRRPVPLRHGRRGPPGDRPHDQAR